MSDEGEFWRDVKPDMIAASKAKRASNRQSSAELLRARGIEFDERNNGAHFVVRHNGKTIQFWPGTGLWHDTTKPGQFYEGRGVRKLLARLEA